MVYSLHGFVVFAGGEIISMRDNALDSMHKKTRQAGSVFTVLLVGIAMASALSLVLYQTISGPMSSMVRVTNDTLDKQAGAKATVTGTEKDNTITVTSVKAQQQHWA